MLAALAVAATVAGCRADGGPRRWALASFTDRDVAVELALEHDAAGTAWLAGTFTPTRQGFHLYGKDLPKEGLRGIGRPTLLEIASGESMRAAGPVQADRATSDLLVPELGLRFPVYPAGPVTLRRPVTFTRQGSAPAELSVTYMACTEGSCLAPAIDRRVRVTIPAAATHARALR
jgi:hypothetical protein